MAIQPRFRIAAALGALIAPMAVVATTATPADAGASKHKHEVTMYKVEKNVKLAGVDSDTVGDSLTQSLSCSPGDFILDGMWLISSVDQYQPTPPDPDDDDPLFPGGGSTSSDARDVYVAASYPSTTGSWFFQFENHAQGDAQLKIYATCIKNKTEANKHVHSIVTTNFGNSGAQLTTQVGAFSKYMWENPSAACGAEQFFVAPGFKFNSGSGRLVSSKPIYSGLGWHWEFASATAPTVTLYGMCLDRKVASYAGHRHVIAMKELPDLAGYNATIPVGDPTQAQFTCDQDYSEYHGYKAMVGWFDMTDWQHNWFLGMEPRPKTRAYKFWNPGPGSNHVRLGALCINSRTSTQFAG